MKFLNILLRIGAVGVLLQSNLAEFLKLSVERVYVLSEKKARGLVTFIGIVLGGPILLATIGSLVGWLGGEVMGIGWVATLASALIKSSALLCALGLVWVWIRATVYAHLLVLAGGLLASLANGTATFVGKVLGTDLSLEAKIELCRADADKFAAWLRNTVAWASLVCMIAMVLPIWRMPAATMTLTVAIIVLAMFMGKVVSVWPQRIAISSALGVAVYCAVILCFPVQVERAEQLVSGVTGSEETADKVLIQGKIDELRNEHREILQRGLDAEKAYASDEDEARDAEIARLIGDYKGLLDKKPAKTPARTAPPPAPVAAAPQQPAAPQPTVASDPLPPATGIAGLGPQGSGASAMETMPASAAPTAPVGIVAPAPAEAPVSATDRKARTLAAAQEVLRRNGRL
jgi:hypothetical protein